MGRLIACCEPASLRPPQLLLLMCDSMRGLLEATLQQGYLLGVLEFSSATPLSPTLPRAGVAELSSAQISAFRLLRFPWFTIHPVLTWRRGAQL